MANLCIFYLYENNPENVTKVLSRESPVPIVLSL